MKIAGLARIISQIWCKCKAVLRDSGMGEHITSRRHTPRNHSRAGRAEYNNECKLRGGGQLAPTKENEDLRFL